MEKLFSQEILGREFHSFDSSTRIKAGFEEGNPVYGGASWYPTEDAQLRRMLSEGADVEQIARGIGRTAAGVRFRMEKLGVSEASNGVSP